MSVTIGELLLKVGLKGSGEAKRELVGVRDTMHEVGSAGLQAKAMILGVVYGLQRLMSHSMDTGTSMSNFATLTGLSTKTLQQFGWAAQQAGLKSEMVFGDFKRVQGLMAEMSLDASKRPEHFNLFAQKTGLDDKRLEDTEYVMLKLQEFAQKTKNMPAISNKFLGNFVSEEMIVAMRRNAFRPEVLNRAPVQSDGQLNRLAGMNVKWENMKSKFELLFAKLASEHGDKFIDDISKVATQVATLIDNIMTLAEKLKVFEVFGTALEGWSKLLSLINTGTGEFAMSPEDMKNPLKGKMAEKWDDVLASHRRDQDMERIMVPNTQYEMRPMPTVIEHKPVVSVTVDKSGNAKVETSSQTNHNNTKKIITSNVQR